MGSDSPTLKEKELEVGKRVGLVSVVWVLLGPDSFETVMSDGNGPADNPVVDGGSVVAGKIGTPLCTV